MSVNKDGQDKVAAITGGGSGIGLAISRIFAASGYSVVITGRDAKRLQKAAEELSTTKSKVTPIACDVRDPGSVEKLFQEIGKHHSTIDVLINNAGVAHALAPVDQLPVETWKEVIDTNLTGTFLVTRGALPLMRAGGTIVNNLSVAALQPFAGMSAYNASKFGALGFTYALREDLRKRGIRVVALLPGATSTEIWGQFWPGAPREKMISAETVGQAVLHAVSVPANTAIEEIRIGPASGVL
ncbi:MAG TPA: SDR family NAD(P)-dependent oxidoreductase [Candidatus Polarisedimenticolia bacterium]|jgi:NAD(P)-dependent dehydrogenase (short-subunit alcohol dehydrogenase family)|nr:SDR family NAD(P)-dependent oxidoreductase [Candidatus Polarisedimenticolia bacterium]